MSKMADIEVKIHWETEKAWLISTDGVKDNAKWFPKRIKDMEEDFEMDEGDGGRAILTAPEWLLTEKELV